MLAGLTEWLDSFGKAWESRDPRAAADLFTEDAVYQWDPFGPKLRGRVMIREAWAERFETEARIQFSYEVLTATQGGGIARWWAEIDEKRVEGILKLSFDDEGLCKELKAWWNAAP